jgi:DNA-binding PadR family transcriptional regulator
MTFIPISAYRDSKLAAQPMSTRHIILGLIREQPSHTYDVAIRFGRRLNAWQVNRGQVYRTVRSLESDGLIEGVEINDDSSRSTCSWRLTQDGEREFERWFSAPTEDVEPLRGELIARLAVAEPSHAPELLLALDWYERALVAQIESDIRDRAPISASPEWTGGISNCISDGVILHRDAELTWVRRTREFVQSWATKGLADDARIVPYGRTSRAI